MKNSFYFIWKAFFVLEIFKKFISIFPSFFPFGRSFRVWPKINLEVVMCLSRNTITHFVWYLEKEKSYDIETLSIDRTLETFLWKNHAENVHQKLVVNPVLILVNNPKQPLMQEILLKIMYFERGLYFFSFGPSRF